MPPCYPARVFVTEKVVFMLWLRALLLAIITPLVKLLVRTNTIPADVQQELGISKEKPIIYLLRTNSMTDLIALQQSARALALPQPTTPIVIAEQPHDACLYLQQPTPVFSRSSKDTGIARAFTELFQLHREDPQLDIQIVPVSVFWGRAPGGKKVSAWAELLDQASPSWLRKFFIVLFFGRDNFVCYSKAVSSQIMVQQHGCDQHIAHKLIRVAGTHFYRRRQAMTGPTLLERQELYNAVLGSAAVKHAIIDKARQKNKSHEQVRQEAKDYIDEIAADYRSGLIRIGERILTRIWNKIYNGIKVGNASRVRELAQNGHEIIYVPCHRSHMDYLLLTYVIYHQGLVTPHIAAGINLSFWPAGPIFRKGGAFFLRRSFAGNKLYTAVFREYLELLFNKGYSVKYYPEGGRSRTGRLLPPKTGMLAMTMQAVIKGVQRPVSIVPVYIGYEHVMEVGSYLKELKGKNKQKESITQVFSAIRKLRNYGEGFVNFGEPIQLNQFLQNQVPDWRDRLPSTEDKKPSWLTPMVNTLANKVMTEVNRSAALNGMSLTALCLLSSKRHTLSENELVSALDQYLLLLRAAPYSSQFTLPATDGQSLLENTLKLDRLSVSQDSYGRVISAQDRQAVELTYYRNNIQHVFALPGLIAAAVHARKGISHQHLKALVVKLYPLLQKELFLHFTQQQAEAYTEQLIEQMVAQAMLVRQGDELLAPDADSAQFYAFWLLHRSIQETLQRYALVLSLLRKHPEINRSRLEQESRNLAERLSSVHGIHSPEFCDKNVLTTFVSALRETGLLQEQEEGLLQHSASSQALTKDIMQLISPDIAQEINNA